MIHYHRGAERPALAITWYDDNGDIIDLTAASFSLKAGTVLTKTTGITGAATAPNVTVLWAAGELDVTAGTYTLQLTATDNGLDRVLEDRLVITDVL